MELTGPARAALGQEIADFKLTLAAQDETQINAAREQLLSVINAVKGS